MDNLQEFKQATLETRPESYVAKIFNQTAAAYAANPSDQKAHKTLEFQIGQND